MSETDPQKTIREALEYASEMSLYSSEWRRYSKALAALKEMGQDSARIADINWIEGIKVGWNYGAAGDRYAFNEALAARRLNLVVAKPAMDAPPPVEPRP